MSIQMVPSSQVQALRFKMQQARRRIDLPHRLAASTCNDHHASSAIVATWWINDDEKSACGISILSIIGLRNGRVVALYFAARWTCPNLRCAMDVAALHAPRKFETEFNTKHETAVSCRHSSRDSRDTNPAPSLIHYPCSSSPRTTKHHRRKVAVQNSSSPLHKVFRFLGATILHHRPFVIHAHIAVQIPKRPPHLHEKRSSIFSVLTHRAPRSTASSPPSRPLRARYTTITQRRQPSLQLCTISPRSRPRHH